MKVKIKGLVFVGFAAAVFAQSAMADANDAKTVTSKLYVDSTFQTLDNITTTSELTVGGDVTEQVVNAHWASNSEYPSMAVLKGVKDSVAGIHGDTNYIEVTEDANGKKVGIITNNLGTTGDITAGTNTGRLATVGAVNGLLDTGISGTETNNTVPTSLAVQTYAEATANKLAYDATNSTETISAEANRGDNTKFPTVKNVYEFVKAENAAYQPKVSAVSTANAVSIGYKAGENSDATWGSLAGTGYVTISGSGGVYTANIDSNQIATSSDYVTTNTDLATAGGVYDFVNGNYQAKATTGDNTIEVGHNGAWANLVGDSTYTSVAMDNGSAKVSLTNLTNATTDFVASNDTNAATNRPKLAKAGDVYDFVMAQTNGLTIPAMPSECTSAANNGGYCALVYGDADDTQNGVQAGLMWTVMAPAPATGNNP